MTEVKKIAWSRISNPSSQKIVGTAQSSNEQIVEKRIHKKCVGCCDNLTCFKSQNYDYCKNCKLNGSRYVQNQCPECGNGSGLIKFPHQPPRPCKLCYLAHQEITEGKYFSK